MPISVPILSRSTPQERTLPHIQFWVDGGRCDGVILYIGECRRYEVLYFYYNWSVRCVVCVL